MTIFQELLDLDVVIQQSKCEVEFINDFANATETERSDIYQRLTTQYKQGDKISMLPRCDCGKFQDKACEGLVCPYCDTVIKSSIEKEIESVVWFRCPEGIAGLMSPIVYTVYSSRFTKKGWDVFAYLTDPNYAPNMKTTPFMEAIKSQGYPRSWNFFITHFDQILEFLFSLRDLNDQIKRGEIDYHFYLWREHRDKFFCNYIPVPNRSFFVFENTNTGIYRNDPTGKAMSYLSIMLSIEKSIQPLSPRAKENRVAKLYQKMSEYQKDHIKTEISPKPGEIRRHVIACRNILAYRSVITSITDPWDYNAITVPWTVGLTMFRPHLVGKLMRKGFSHMKAIDLLLSHTGHYHRLLDHLLNELIEEAPEQKIWTTIQRNPSLKQGSMQLVYIGKFKTDPGDKTTGMPLPIVKAPNAFSTKYPKGS